MSCPCRSVRTQMCHGKSPPRSCPPRPVQSTLMMSGSLRSGAASWTPCISTGSVTPVPPSNLRDATALSVSLSPVLSMSRTVCCPWGSKSITSEKDCTVKTSISGFPNDLGVVVEKNSTSVPLRLGWQRSWTSHCAWSWLWTVTPCIWQRSGLWATLWRSGDASCLCSALYQRTTPSAPDGGLWTLHGSPGRADQFVAWRTHAFQFPAWSLAKCCVGAIVPDVWAGLDVCESYRRSP